MISSHLNVRQPKEPNFGGDRGRPGPVRGKRLLRATAISAVSVLSLAGVAAAGTSDSAVDELTPSWPIDELGLTGPVSIVPIEDSQIRTVVAAADAEQTCLIERIPTGVNAACESNTTVHEDGMFLAHFNPDPSTKQVDSVSLYVVAPSWASHLTASGEDKVVPDSGTNLFEIDLPEAIVVDVTWFGSEGRTHSVELSVPSLAAGMEES